MKNIEDVIQIVYSKMVDIIVNDLKEDEKIIAENEYKRILQNRYSNLQIKDNDYEKLYEKIFKIEYTEWSSLALPMKKHILLKDKALSSIIDITSEAFKFAKNRLNKKELIPVELAEKNISELDALYECVKDYNKTLAQWHISEGKLDLKYSSGQTEDMSLRIGHLK